LQTTVKGARRSLFLLVFLAAACQPPAAVEQPSTNTPRLSPPPLSTSTVSPSPAPPTATPTLAPAERLFTEEFEGAAPFWQYVQAGGRDGALEADAGGGSVRLNLAAPNVWALAVYEPQAYADVRVDAQVDLGTSGEGAAGLICRHDPAAGWYEFNIYADNTYAILFGQWLAEGVARYTPLVISESEAIRQGANEIGLACEGDVLTPYINGVQIRRRQESLHVLHEGQVGVSAASFETAPLVIVVDWVRVGNP
jgi:hypothetical protein